MKFQQLILVLSTILLISVQSKFLQNEQNKMYGALYPDQKSYWFDQQILDHFIQVPVTYWSQRYTVYEKVFDKLTGPLILYIGGEGPADGISEKSAFPITIAQKFNGIVITLEHRFYGESQPFGQNDQSYSTENLRYLTQEQGLADIATFIEYIKSSNKFGITKDTPVITIGGSYPGALSAWFRYEYRHLTIGSLASSAVVDAIDDFQEYDNQTRLSANAQNDVCADNIVKLTEYAEEQVLEKGGQAAVDFKKYFGAEQLGDQDFFFYYADIFAQQVQYGATSNLCKELQGTQEEQLANIQKFALSSLNPDDYDQIYMKNDTTYGKNKALRQWTYQTCTYFGWFQTASEYKPMRSKIVDLKYFQNLCENVFGEGYIPNPKITNQMMGGRDLRVDNLIFTNGIEDPWRWASIQENKFPMEAILIDCIDCAHCVDLHTPSSEQPIQVTQAQEQILETMEIWIGEYWNNLIQQQ